MAASDLIDGVIQAGSDFGVQCLQFVNNVTHGAGAGYGSAASLTSAAQTKGILHSMPGLGDIAVWGAGVNGAGASGHAAIVTGLGGGQVAVTGTNWPANSGAAQTVVGHNAIGMGNPSGYIDPNAIGGQNIITNAPSLLPNAIPTLTSSGALATGPGPGGLLARGRFSVAVS